MCYRKTRIISLVSLFDLKDKNIALKNKFNKDGEIDLMKIPNDKTIS